MIDYLSKEEKMPEIIEELKMTRPMRRLDEVGMHCGLEYTSFPFFKDLKKYSRYDHSLGVAMIIYHFTHDEKQAVAGLFHDISTPAFAHVVDFLHGDYDRQEATESPTEEVISSSKEIMDVLEKKGILLEEISDYHLYPIADNETPKLSADRLEYSLSNFINFGFLSKEEIQDLYDDIKVGKNEYGEEELVFLSLEKASIFGHNVLKNSKVYVSDPDRYSMERLSRVIKRAIDKGIVTIDELYKLDEPSLIGKLKEDEGCYKEFLSFKNMKSLTKSETHLNDKSYMISAKKRYIDPYIEGQGRLSQLDEGFASSLRDFLSMSFAYWLTED